jgi:hypothetical protein
VAGDLATSPLIQALSVRLSIDQTETDLGLLTRSTKGDGMLTGNSDVISVGFFPLTLPFDGVSCRVW